MSTRRKWSTTWASRTDKPKSHRSEKAVYDWLGDQATALRDGAELSDTVVNVWVDERLGRGWERYERVDLREHAAFVEEVKPTSPDEPNSPFREAIAGIHGTSWLAEAARTSLRAADRKFFGTSTPTTETKDKP